MLSRKNLEADVSEVESENWRIIRDVVIASSRPYCVGVCRPLLRVWIYSRRNDETFNFPEQRKGKILFPCYHAYSGCCVENRLLEPKEKQREQLGTFCNNPCRR